MSKNRFHSPQASKEDAEVAFATVKTTGSSVGFVGTTVVRGDVRPLPLMINASTSHHYHRPLSLHPDRDRCETIVNVSPLGQRSARQDDGVTPDSHHRRVGLTDSSVVTNLNSSASRLYLHNK